jgi:hypothetical protein
MGYSTLFELSRAHRDGHDFMRFQTVVNKAICQTVHPLNAVFEETHKIMTVPIRHQPLKKDERYFPFESPSEAKPHFTILNSAFCGLLFRAFVTKTTALPSTQSAATLALDNGLCQKKEEPTKKGDTAHGVQESAEHVPLQLQLRTLRPQGQLLRLYQLPSQKPGAARLLFPRRCRADLQPLV